MIRDYILLLSTEKLIEELEYHERKVAERHIELRSRLVAVAEREKQLTLKKKQLTLDKLVLYRAMETLLTIATPQEIEHTLRFIQDLIEKLEAELRTYGWEGDDE